MIEIKMTRTEVKILLDGVDITEKLNLSEINIRKKPGEDLSASIGFKPDAVDGYDPKTDYCMNRPAGYAWINGRFCRVPLESEFIETGYVMDVDEPWYYDL